MASSPSTRVPWREHWAHAWRLSPIALQRAHERNVDRPRREHLAVGRGYLKPAGVDPRRLSVADVPHRGLAVARALERLGARQTPHLCLGDIVRHTLPGGCAYRIVGQSAGTLGRGADPIAGLRLVLHYDFVFACFSSSSRIKGIVSRRCSTIEASSSASRSSNSEGRSRAIRFTKYSEVSSGRCKPRCAARKRSASTRPASSSSCS